MLVGLTSEAPHTRGDRGHLQTETVQDSPGPGQGLELDPEVLAEYHLPSEAPGVAASLQGSGDLYDKLSYDQKHRGIKM